MNAEAQPTRSGEELDQEKLKAYLHSRLPDKTSGVEILQFPAGSSNLTYLIRFGSDEYVLRRPPFGNTIKTAHDMSREFRVLSQLSTVYKPAPKPLLFCEDENVIGSQFYLMERRKGLIIRGKAGSENEDFNTSQEYREKVCRNFVRNLAELHSLDYDTVGLGELGKPDGYNRRQVEGWSKRYLNAKTDDVPEIEKTIVWLNDNIPAESGAALIHNDYKFDNIMLDPNDLTKITAVLDWEMVTIGDPLMDLGTTLGYWMSADAGEEMLNMPFNPRVLMENISRRELAEMYANASGRDISNILFYYVFGTSKIAVIAQQIYARFVKGLTRDKRFANFDKFVATLGDIACNAINRSSI